MELDILHRAVAPEIVEFYGAFFVEGCVYYCMEYMVRFWQLSLMRNWPVLMSGTLMV